MILRNFALAGIALLLVAACYGREGQSGSISVDREAFVSGLGGSPNVIIRTAEGNLVVAGSWQSAWAVSLDDTGHVLWRYRKELDPAETVGQQSAYHGAVQLANGNILLCGETVANGGRGLITILDRQGRLIEDRQVAVTHTNGFASFQQCFFWKDNIAVIGTLVGSSWGQPVGWVLRLDKNGAPAGEVVSPKLLSRQVVAGPNGSLVFATRSRGDQGEETRVSILDSQLQVVASRSIGSSAFGLLAPVAPISGARLIIYQRGEKATLYSLSEQLEDAQPPRSIQPIYVDQGRGYVLPDESLLLFGYVYKGGPYTAVVARIGASGGTDSLHTFMPQFASFTTGDVLPLAADRFVSVRLRAGATAAETGIVIAWVSIK